MIKTANKSIKVKDSDDYCDLLLCGTEVEGSCQNVHYDPTFSKCLLAYLLDGKNRMVAITDQSDQIQARCIIRLLWDEKKLQPILFKERAYFKGGYNREYEKIIHNMCLSRAKKLGISLLSKDKSGKTYDGKVQIVQTKTSYEYVDSAEGIINQGESQLISPVFKHL